MPLTRAYFKTIIVICSLFLFTACAGKFIQKKDENISIDAQSKLQFGEALKLQKDGNIGKAKLAYEQLHERHPEYIGPLANLGVIAMQQGLAEKAETYFLNVIEIEATQKNALNYLGVLSRQKGQFEKAEDYYRQALAVDADYPEAIRNLAILLDLYRGRLEEALALYEQYQQLQTEPDPNVNDWIYDTKSRLNVE